MALLAVPVAFSVKDHLERKGHIPKTPKNTAGDVLKAEDLAPPNLMTAKELITDANEKYFEI